MNKHTNICFKSRFDGYPSLYTCAFDYKLIQWNCEDVKNKTVSRNIYELLSSNLGKEALQYNPPFVYCMGFYNSKSGARQVVVGLGNGMLLRFKKKGL